jgi:hypothetical protein
MDNELGMANFLGAEEGRLDCSSGRNGKFFGSLKNARIYDEMK